MRHSAGRRKFSKKAGATAVLHFTGKLAHGLLRNNAAFASSKGSSGIIERQQKFRPLPLAFFPQSKRFLHGVLFRLQPSAFNGAASKNLLIGGKVYVHRFQNTGKVYHWVAMNRWTSCVTGLFTRVREGVRRW
jgi:hypothetical protein